MDSDLDDEIHPRHRTGPTKKPSSLMPPVAVLRTLRVRDSAVQTRRLVLRVQHGHYGVAGRFDLNGLTAIKLRVERATRFVSRFASAA